MTKRISLGFVIAIVILAIAATFAITYNVAMNNFNDKVIELNERQEMYSKLSTVDQEVRSKYYTDVNNTDVTNGSIEGYMEALNDPQSEYLSKQDYDLALQNQNKVDANDVKSSKINNNIGYIKISNFTVGTDARFKSELTNLQNSGVTSIVIDVRNNTGKNVDSAVDCVDALVNSGNLLSVKYKDGTQEVVSDANAEYSPIPICVLTNQNTALGAEIFAGDIKSCNRGKVYGTTTAGIGTRADMYPLSDGSAIKLSVANYLIADGSTFTGTGISPSVQVTLSDEQEKAYAQGTLSVYDDTVIQQAVNELNPQS